MNFHSKDRLQSRAAWSTAYIQDLLDQKDSLNTKKSVNHSVKVVREYCREKGSNVKFDPKELDECWTYSMLISGRKIANSTSLVHLAFILK